MAIKIQTQTPYIPIEVGELKLKFDMTDDNIKCLYDSEKQFQEKLNSVEDGDFEGQKKAIKTAVDFLLGDGAFDKLYSVTPSLVVVVEYFVQISIGLKEEIEKRTGQTQQAKVQKYLQNKNKQNQNRNRNRKK